MRRLGMAVAAVLLCATMGFARENRNNVSKEPFAINFEKLSNYLQLSSYQANEVANINEYFLFLFISHKYFCVLYSVETQWTFAD